MKVIKAHVLARDDSECHTHYVETVKLLRERVKATVHHVIPVPQDPGFKHVPAIAVLLKHGVVQVEEHIVSLVVQRYQLDAISPEEKRVKIRRVDANGRRVGSNKLIFCVLNEIESVPSDEFFA
jgi:hypothetical protein